MGCVICLNSDKETFKWECFFEGDTDPYPFIACIECAQKHANDWNHSVTSTAPGNKIIFYGEKKKTCKRT